MITTVSINGNTLTADATGATYQWLNCDYGNAIIPSETNQTFTATANGNYAVIITKNGCIDTSNCYHIMSTNYNLEQKDITNQIFPNPSSGVIIINMGKEKLTPYQFLMLVDKKYFSKP